MTSDNKTVIIGGLGPGLGLALSNLLIDSGYRVAGLSRSDRAHSSLIAGLDSDSFMTVGCDLADVNQVSHAYKQIEDHFGPASVYIHNAAGLHMQPFNETTPDVFEALWRSMCLGAVHGSQQVLPDMLDKHMGTLLFIGATASVKAGANFSAFGSAKFALRGLAQSLARELGPQGIHVAHLLIDGVMWGERARNSFGMTQDQCIDPAAVAQTCLHLIEQDRSAWTHEIDVRPDVEAF